MARRNDEEGRRNDVLRYRAEELISGSRPLAEYSADQVQELVHELMVHQAELQIQNEELRRTQIELEETKNKYYALYYDAAPVAYLTLDRHDLIVEINACGLSILGKEKSLVFKKPFRRFVHQEDRGRYLDHLERLKDTKAVQSCELRLVQDDGTELYIHMESRPEMDAGGNAATIRSALIDVTDSKKAEQQRLEAEKKFRTLAENAPDFIVYLDRDLRFLYVNPPVEAITGKGREEFIGRTIEEAGIPEEFSRIFAEKARSVFLKGKGVTLDFSYPGSRGVRTYNAKIFPEISPEGIVDFVMAIGRDITELKKIEEELEARVRERTAELSTANEMLRRENSEREKAESDLRIQSEVLQTIIDNIPAMLCLDDRKGRTRLINKPFEDLTGWTLEDTRGDDFLDRVYPDSKQLHEVLDSWDKEGTRWMDLKTGTKDGRVIPGSWSRVMLSTGEMIFIGIDLTDRIRSEQERIRLAAAIEQAGNAIAIANSEGLIQYVNKAFERINGMKRARALGKEAAPLLARRAWIRREIQDAFSRGKNWQGQLRRKTGAADLELEVDITPFRDPFGNIASYLIIEKDVTRERVLERNLLTSQRMEAIGVLASGIAHDLNNILNPVIISSETALAELPVDSPVRPDLEIILESGSKGKDLVRRILSFSPRRKEELKPLDLGILIRNSIKLIRGALPPAVEVKMDISEGDGNVVAEPIQMHQVILNLATNAAYAMRGKDGELTIRLDHVDVDPEKAKDLHGIKPGRFERLTVSDTGAGMTKDVQDHIFEPFFSTKGQEEGTGLGLSVVYGIVRNHHGAITVSSRPGKGSTFEIFLPRAQ